MKITNKIKWFLGGVWYFFSHVVFRKDISLCEYGRQRTVKIIFKLRDAFWQTVYQRYYEVYDVDKTFKFKGTNNEFWGKGKIIIGKNGYIAGNSKIRSSENNKVTIGENVAISHGVYIRTMNYISKDILEGRWNPSQQAPNWSTGDVIIGNNCWIGYNSFIREGVSIGNNCVIGANSVVTLNIPDNSVAAGVPAKIIKTNKNRA